MRLKGLDTREIEPIVGEVEARLAANAAARTGS